MKTTTTNPQKEGKRIHDVLLTRDTNTGATVFLVMAGMGGVKTGFCLDYAEKIMQWYPDEPVLWRESLKSPVQFTKLKNYDYNILIEEKLNLIFKNINTNKEFIPKYTTFKNYDDLLNKCKKQHLNIVFFNNEENWKDLIEHCNNINGWYTILFDEIEDIFPSGTRDNQWHWIQTCADTIKHCRRGLTTIGGNCHKGHTIDYRIYDKVMIHVYGFGSKPDTHSRIRRECLDGITRGEFWIEEEHTRFGYLKLKNEYIPKNEAWTITKKND